MNELPVRFGLYQLVRPIGRGGMGEVHLAHDLSQDGRAVALKVLPAHLSADAGYRERFRREAERAARLTHPHVVPIHRYGDVDGRLFLDMRFVDGPDLATLLLRHGPLPPARAVDVVGQIADALDAAHRDGLVHGDVKPANILLAGLDPDVALLADFGIATAPGERDGHGTVEYLAPERLAGGPVGPAADVYALACVLHELLTGERAFPGGEFAAQAHGHLHRPPPRPERLRPGLPRGFDAVVARGLAKDPARRYRSTGALAVAARGVVAGPRLRRRSLVAGVAGLAVLGIGGVVAARALWPASSTPGRTLGVRSSPRFPLVPTLLAPGRPAVLVRDPGGVLRVWDVLADRTVGPAPPGEQPRRATVVPVAGRPALVRPVPQAYDMPGSRFTAVDLESAEVVGGSFEDPSGPPVAVAGAAPDGGTVVASLGSDGVVRRFRPDDGSPVGEPFAPAPGEPAHLRVIDLAGRAALVRTDLNPGLDVFWLDTAELVVSSRYPPGRLSRRFEHSVPAAVDGAITLLSVVLAGIEVVDAATLERLRSIDEPGARVVVAATVDGRAVLVTDRPRPADRGRDLIVRDLASGTPVGAPLVGHTAPVQVLDVLDPTGAVQLVSQALDNEIRVWDLAEHVRRG